MKAFLAVVAVGVLFLLGLAFWYLLIPYLLTILVNSFGFEVAYWQSILVWFFIMIFTILLKRGGKE